MSVHFEAARNRWVVRWRYGRNRSRRFGSLEEAEAFDESLRCPPVVVPVEPAARGDGIYAYGTTAGVRPPFHVSKLETDC